MNDKIKINLQIADKTFPLSIHRNDEEIVRKAAKEVNVRLNHYRDYFTGQPLENLLAMVAYQFSLEKLKEENRNDTAPYIKKIEKLTEMLENYMDSESKKHF